MKVRRVVPNIPTMEMNDSRAFYADVLGLEVAMDRPLGGQRIMTLVSPDNPTAQVTLVGGGAPEAVPTVTVEVADPDAVFERRGPTARVSCTL